MRLVENRILKVSMQFTYVLFNNFYSVRYNLSLELEFIVNAGFGDIRVPRKHKQWGEAVQRGMGHDQFLDQSGLITFIQSSSG